MGAGLLPRPAPRRRAAAPRARRPQVSRQSPLRLPVRRSRAPGGWRARSLGGVPAALMTWAPRNAGACVDRIGVCRPRKTPVGPCDTRPPARPPACPSGFCPAGVEECEPLALCFSKWSPGTPIPASQTPESEPAVAGESAFSADILDGLVQMAVREPRLHTT